MAFTSNTYTPLTVPEILLAALRLPFASSPALFFPLLLLSLLSSTSLLLYFSSAASPALHHLLSTLSLLFKHPSPPPPPDLLHQLLPDLHSFARLAAILTPPTLVATLLLTLSSTYTLSKAYTNSKLTPKALVQRLVQRAYKTLVTMLYVLIFGVGYIVLSSTIITTLLLACSSSKELDITTLSTATSFCTLGVVLMMYLATRGAMSVVISVNEETWGIGALSWSVELFIGNKQRGTLLTCVVMAIRVLVYGVVGWVVVGSEEPAMEEEKRRVLVLVAAAAAVWEMYCVGVYTVFYYECRKSHGLDDGGDGADEKQGFVYSSLPVSAVKVGYVY